MEQSSTLLTGKKPLNRLVPRRHIIENLLNYSKSLSIIRLPLGETMVVSNN